MLRVLKQYVRWVQKSVQRTWVFGVSVGGLCAIVFELRHHRPDHLFGTITKPVTIVFVAGCVGDSGREWLISCHKQQWVNRCVSGAGCRAIEVQSHGVEVLRNLYWEGEIIRAAIKTHDERAEDLLSSVRATDNVPVPSGPVSSWL